MDDKVPLRKENPVSIYLVAFLFWLAWEALRVTEQALLQKLRLLENKKFGPWPKVIAMSFYDALFLYIFVLVWDNYYANYN